MLGEKAITLIKELDRNRDNLPPYNTDLVNDVSKETLQLLQENRDDLQRNEETNMPAVRIRHETVTRNVRCLLAYHYNRIGLIRTMRWEFGSILPADIKANMNSSELEWFSQYSSSLAKYMRSVGDRGINLAVDLKPPKSVYIDVRCLVDYGRFELSDGSVLLLKKNSMHYLPRAECEELITQGVFEHIVS